MTASKLVSREQWQRERVALLEKEGDFPGQWPGLNAMMNIKISIKGLSR